MRYLNKIVFLNSAHVPYAEVKVDGNVHFIGTQGVGKSTLLRAVLFFYNADKLRLGIPKEKKKFDPFYLPFANSYIIYEVMRENGAYSVVVTKSMGRAAYRFVDAPYSREWFVNEDNEVLADWPEIRKRIPADIDSTSLIIDYYEFRDIIFGNNRNPKMVPFRKYAIVESSNYQNIPRTIQNVFLNSKLDADFIKDTIIRSMSDDDQSINLTYYRSQIDVFEQEYHDVMLWVKPNRNGVVEVRRQAGKVIDAYRSLLYQQKLVEEGRAELNFAEKEARQALPVLDGQIKEAEERVNHANRMMAEARRKHDEERDVLVGRTATLSAKLKEVAGKRRDYEQKGIEEVKRRVAQEEALGQELESQKKTLAELTDTHKDVMLKYSRLTETLERDFKDFESARREEMLEKREQFGARKDRLYARMRDQEVMVNQWYEEKREELNGQVLQAEKMISELKLRRTRVSLTQHYADKIQECSAELERLKQEETAAAMEIDRLKLEGDRLRQKASAEVSKKEWEAKAAMEELRQQRECLKREIAELQELFDSRKGSLCEWLEKNKPGWRENIGKVADEKLILYSQHLKPELAEGMDDACFGVRLRLDNVERELRTPEQLKAEMEEKQQQDEVLVQQLDRMVQKLEETKSKIKKKYKTLTREISERQHLLEAQHLLYPARLKELEAEGVTWQRKEEEWKKEQLEDIDRQMLEQQQLQLQTAETQERLAEERNRRLQQAEADRKAEELQAEKERDEEIRRLNEMVAARRTELEVKIAEIRQSQHQELDGKGADTAVIGSCQQRIDEIGRELKYIGEMRSFVSDYEKDKRELFDREPQFEEEKKACEAQLADLDKRYAQEQGTLKQELDAAAEDCNGKKTAAEELRKDVKKLEDFKADAKLCPPESFTTKEKATKKGCGKIIEQLISRILTIKGDTDEFKKSVNQFSGNFTTKNTFNFATSLNTVTDYYDFAANLCEFVEDDKIAEYQHRISERYTNIIQRISKETGDLTRNESEIHKTIRAINNDFVERNFAGVIRSIELRALPSDDKLMQLLLEIKEFNEQQQFNMGGLDLFTQDTRLEMNEKAVRYLYAFSRLLKTETGRKSLVLSDTFNLQFRVVENDNDTGWVEKIANVGSDGTDILVKAMVNIMLINVFKEKASRKFGDFKLHCMMDEIGKLHPNNVKGILDFANCRNILLINSSPTTYNVEDYKYTYLLGKDAKSNTKVVPLLARKA